MFEVFFADWSNNNQVIGNSYMLNSLPTVGQKISIDGHGVYVVLRVALSVGKHISTSYGVIVKPANDVI